MEPVECFSCKKTITFPSYIKNTYRGHLICNNCNSAYDLTIVDGNIEGLKSIKFKGETVLRVEYEVPDPETKKLFEKEVAGEGT